MGIKAASKIVVAAFACLVLSGCAKKLKAPDVDVPKQTPVSYAEAATPSPAPATPAPSAAAVETPCDEGTKFLKLGRDDIAAAVDVTPDLIEAQALLDVAKKKAGDGEAAMAMNQCAEAIALGKEASAKAKEAEELALRMKREQMDADCQAADSRIKQAQADVDAAHKAGAEKWEPALMEQADAALVQAKALFAAKKCSEAAAPANDASVKAKAALAAKPAEKPKSDSRYRVVRGDCLWNIAGKREILADFWVWPLIYQSNRDQISDPNLILPGQLFLIPKDSSPEHVKEAVSQAQAAPWPRK